MEIDAVNIALATNSRQDLDQRSLGLSPKATRVLDLSQEHTNGRMFEQAVQNANKSGETSASSSDNVKVSNSKIDQNDDVKNENPLILNQKDARFLKNNVQSDKPEEAYDGQGALKQALQTQNINYATLSQMSRDTIFVKGQAIDGVVAANNTSLEHETTSQKVGIKLGEPSNITEQQLKRQQVQKIAEEAYFEIEHLEVEEGKAFGTCVVQGLSEASFGEEVVFIVFDQQIYGIET